ncbi:MAG TPA: GerMN domain-containing protein [Clostridiales bacterium]|nr:GerMN domain-containing protein [Clostridiales bacterium]
MKKTYIIISIIVTLLMLTGCQKANSEQDPSPTLEPTPSAVPVVTASPSDDTSEEPEDVNKDHNNRYTIEDYYIIEPDTEYVYEGSGMEYASYNIFLDYYDEDTKRYQTRTDNGGTVSGKVMEIKDGKLLLLHSEGEFYYRDNLLNINLGNTSEILLMEPLVKGTEWTLADKSKRYISEVDVKIETELGSYEALEVTTKYEDSITKDYYAPGVGFVKSIFTTEDNYQVTSTLKEMNKTPLVQEISLFYPNQDGKIYVYNEPITFHTNDITRLVLEKTIKDRVIKNEELPLMGINTKIKSMYLGKDMIVYIDFSKEFIDEMNAGAAYESLILQSITNTLGNYYGADEVYIMVEGKPYESGHILLKKGETLKVNMDLVVE